MTDEHWLPALLDSIEDLLLKMIAGIFRFTLIHIPRELYRFIIRTFPTLMKMLRVLLLLGAWCLLAFGPLMAIHLPDSWVPRNSSFSEWYTVHSTVGDLTVYAYSALAPVASVWGIYHVKRRREKLDREAEVAAQGRRVSRTTTPVAQ